VIAKTLNVDAIVEGSVAREGGQVRITANLIDARADSTIWTMTLTRNSNDVLALQTCPRGGDRHADQGAAHRAREGALRERTTVNSEAHDAYLLGRYFFNRPSDENLQKAIAQFEKSVKLDSTFAAGFSGLSDAYLWAGYNEGYLTATEGKIKSKQAALRAVQLDSMSAEAHASLATFLLFYDKDWQACEREYRKAIALNSNYAFAHDQFGMALAFVGRLDEGIAEGKRAAELDPLSPQILIDASITYLYRKDTVSAIQLARRAASLDSTYFFPVMIEGWAHLETGQYERAIPLLQKASTMYAPPFVTAYLAFAQGMAGHRDAGAQADCGAREDVARRQGAAVQSCAGVPRRR
jgi:tetratricopeptide (TPR) repeat protein